MWKGTNLRPDTFCSPAGEVFASLATSGKAVEGEEIGSYGSSLAPQSKTEGWEREGKENMKWPQSLSAQNPRVVSW